MNQSSIQQHFYFIKPGEKKYRIEPSGDLKKTLKKDLKIPSSKIKSLLTPIPLIPSLSCSTQELINSLQVEKTKTSAEFILTSLPAKEKFAELLSPLRSFPLPYHYKKLVISLEFVDKALNYLNLTEQDSTIENVSNYVQHKCGISFNIEFLQKILSIYDAYELV